jgi:hypothetical protein
MPGPERKEGEIRKGERVERESKRGEKSRRYN